MVTGSTLGIGAGIAKAFYATGDRVVISARRDNGFAASLGTRALFQSADVTEPAQLHQLVETAMSWTGRLDVFINNAGLSSWRPLALVDESFWHSMLDVNLKSVLFGCQAAAAALNAGGVIINISSMAAKRGTANNSVYCAAKFGVNGVTQALAKELGPRKIRVNAVCPVLVATEGLLAALDQEHSPAKDCAVDFLESFARSNAALGRLPTVAEVAEYCVYLASPQASALTGQCINVDCGVFPQ